LKLTIPDNSLADYSHHDGLFTVYTLDKEFLVLDEFEVRDEFYNLDKEYLLGL
jgi:hypothetical protein